jgi:hypothetical protein
MRSRGVAAAHDRAQNLGDAIARLGDRNLQVGEHRQHFAQIAHCPQRLVDRALVRHRLARIGGKKVRQPASRLTHGSLYASLHASLTARSTPRFTPRFTPHFTPH